MGSTQNGKTGPLDGIRVLDWTIAQFGPVSTMMLADMGAEVIKIESLDGDSGRQVERVGGYNSGLPDDISGFFESLNRQKLGIALDLKNPRGVEIMCELVKRSNVLVQNFRQGVAERLGLGYDDLIQHNPQIIYASASGYGPQGPDSGRPASGSVSPLQRTRRSPPCPPLAVSVLPSPRTGWRRSRRSDG